MSIAICVPSGRPFQLKKVISSFILNARKFEHDLNNFNLYISIDTEFSSRDADSFILSSPISSVFNKVTYITKNDRLRLCNTILNSYEDKIKDYLFFGNGYGQQRNALLVYSFLDNNQFAIYFDDDEYPFIPYIENKTGELFWKEFDFFGNHIRALQNGADITRGICKGYLSPLPTKFLRTIDKKIRLKLGYALSLGNEVICKDTFLDLSKNLRLLNEYDFDQRFRPFEVKETVNGKEILAGNMGINLASVRLGKVPLFFTPFNARGEDAIFALQLSRVKVVEVASYIFHDPFLYYKDLYKLAFPKSLVDIETTPNSLKRFSKVIIGWLRYAPIFIVLSSKNIEEVKRRYGSMLNEIEEPLDFLSERLNCKELSLGKTILQDYFLNSSQHVYDLVECQKAWMEVLSNDRFLKMRVDCSPFSYELNQFC